MRMLLDWRRYRGKQVSSHYQQGTDRHYKEWRTPCGRYRVTWRDQFDGVEIDSGYYPCVRGPVEHNIKWDRLFASQRKLNRTFKAAQTLCEKHFRANFPREAASITGRCAKPGCQKKTLEGTDFCGTHQSLNKKRKAIKKRKSPKKECPNCSLIWGCRKLTCSCGYEF